MPTMYEAEGRGTASSHLFVAIPVTAAPEVPTFMSVLAAVKQIDPTVCLEVGNCHVDDARNALVRRFLQTDCTHLMFVDADVGFRAANMARLPEYGRDIVAGVYPKKQDFESYPVRLLPGGARADADGLVEVEGAPTGFMCIARDVIERLIARPETRHFHGQADVPGGAPYYLLFERTLEDGHRWSGDYAFCRKVRAMGGKIFVDPDMRFAHQGPKQWIGSLADHWRRRAGIESPKLGEALRRLRAGDASHETFVALCDAWANENYSVMPDCLMAVFRLAKRARGPILETGSGLTTLVMAAATSHPVYALEGDVLWRARIVKALTENGLSANVFHAPVVDHGGFSWYAIPDGLPASFSTVLCDGPQSRYGRDGLWRLLGERVRDAELVVDDADNASILAMIEAHAGDRDVHVLGTEGQKKFALVLRREPERAAA